jgi:DNA-binding transcriptional LysR family regulator
MHGDHRVNRLKLHELQVLLAVAQAGSMAKAAAQLAMSEPAVSRSISDMERTLGVSLFDRSSKGVKSTPYGRALIKRGVAVFDELRQGIREIETIKDPTIGEVHIGATSTIAEVGIIAPLSARCLRNIRASIFMSWKLHPSGFYTNFGSAASI